MIFPDPFLLFLKNKEICEENLKLKILINLKFLGVNKFRTRRWKYFT